MAKALDDPTLLVQVAHSVPEFPEATKLKRVERMNTLVYCPRRGKTGFVKDILVPLHTSMTVEEGMGKNKSLEASRRTKLFTVFSGVVGRNKRESFVIFFSLIYSVSLISLLKAIREVLVCLYSALALLNVLIIKGDIRNNCSSRASNQEDFVFSSCAIRIDSIIRYLASIESVEYGKFSAPHSLVAEPQQQESEENEHLVTEGERKMVASDQLPERAYWVQRTLCGAIYGQVRYGVVLRRKNRQRWIEKRVDEDDSGREEYANYISDAEWEMTREYFAVKEMEWKRIQQLQGKHSENPLNEIAALQYLMEDNRRQHAKNVASTNTSNEAFATETEVNGRSGLSMGSSSFYSPGSAHVLLPMEIVSDEKCLYVISPYCNRGELFDLMQSSGKFSETEARYWMKQILKGLDHFQRAGICHRDLSFENILIHDRRTLIIDLGMCLRVPFERDVCNRKEQADVAGDDNYDDDHDDEHVKRYHETQSDPSRVVGRSKETEHVPASISMDTGGGLIFEDVGGISPTSSSQTETQSSFRYLAERGRRLLFPPMGTCGKWMYMPPEICFNESFFDGFAVDLWAAGIILFIMVTGVPPWQHPIDTDERFHYMSSKMLMAQMLTKSRLRLSPELMDLLQMMLAKRPSRRLTLQGVLEHPWMKMKGRASSTGSRAFSRSA